MPPNPDQLIVIESANDPVVIGGQTRLPARNPFPLDVVGCFPELQRCITNAAQSKRKEGRGITWPQTPYREIGHGSA